LDLHRRFTRRDYGRCDEVKENDMFANDVKQAKLRTRVLVATGLVVLAVTLFRVPLATVFTLGVLLICPLLMVGMHGGHGGGHGDHAASADDVRANADVRHGGR
jgi:hypothetical protein